MKSIIKKYKVLLIITLIPYLFIIISSIIKIDYSITTPASIASVSNVIRIGNDKSNNVNTVSVFSYDEVTLLDYLIGKVNKSASIEKLPNYVITDLNSSKTSGTIQKLVSMYNAIIVGYKKAGIFSIVDEDSFKGYIVHTIYKYTSKDIQLGDVITHINGEKLKGFTGKNEFNEYFKNLKKDPNDVYELTVLRKVNEDNKTITKELKVNVSYQVFEDEGKKYISLGIATYEYVIPNQSENIPEFSINYGDTIGPSGGLMQALYVYDSLTNHTLTKGRKIVGTGTVDLYGKAGLIGGIYQKVITAHYCNAEIFFVPVLSSVKEEYEKEDNYIEAIASYKKLNNPKMKLVVVSSLDDIIEYLSNN